MNKLEEIYDNIKNNVPFCFVRLNDGEVKAMRSTDALISRANDKSSELMLERFHNMVTDDFNHDKLYIGVPCNLCYNELYNYVVEKLNTKGYTKYFDANLLINVNYNKTLEVLSMYLQDKNIIVVCNEIASKNINRLKKLNITVNDIIVISTKYAFEKDYNQIKDRIFSNNAFIITLCGPLGRILSYEWFKQNSTLSCLDLGSFFDPILQNRSHFYHTNNFGYCPQCYPLSYEGYSDIFQYCDEYVTKECYYLPTIEDHLRVFGHDYNRIINNSKVRLEKEQDNILLYGLLTYSKINLNILQHLPNYQSTVNEGYIMQCYDEFLTVVNLVRKYNPKNILEIGFLLGSSSAVFLDNSEATVTSIELRELTYTNQIKDILNRLYPNRHRLLIGDSTTIFPTLTDIYDMIFIDGGHEYNVALQDIINGYYHANEYTIVVIDDIVNHTDYYKTTWTVGPTSAYNICIENKMLIPISKEEYDVGRGIVACRYNKPNTFNKICKDIVLHELASNEDSIDKNITVLHTKKLLKQLSPSDMLTEGYTFQNISLYFELISLCKRYNPSSILEIGFLYGTSSLLFLLNSTAHVTSIEIVENNFNINLAKTMLSTMFSNRFTLMYGDSNDVVQTLHNNNNEYDMVFIDGNHDRNHILRDLVYLNNMTIEDRTIFILNDVVKDPAMYMSWNFGPNQVYDDLLNNQSINVLLCKSYSKGRGLAAFTFKKKANEILLKLLSKNETEKLIKNNKYSKKILKQVLRYYFEYFHLLLSDDKYFEYDALLNDYDISYYENVFHRYTSKMIKDKALEILKTKYTKTNVDIPKIIHFIYLNQKPLKKFHYKCFNSAIKHMSDYTIYIHNDIEPDDLEWRKLKKHSNVIIKKTNRIPYYDNYQVPYVQYEADILRLRILYKYGGIYLDNDMYILKNFSKLLENGGIYYGVEKEGGLINSIVASPSSNEFIDILLKCIKPGIRINSWGNHIRDIPKMLLEEYPYYKYKYHIYLLPYHHFFNIHWTEGGLLNDPNFVIIDDMYGVHLYDTILHNSLDNCYLLEHY